jgi:hypothetical protein
MGHGDRVPILDQPRGLHPRGVGAELAGVANRDTLAVLPCILGESGRSWRLRAWSTVSRSLHDSRKTRIGGTNVQHRYRQELAARGQDTDVAVWETAAKRVRSVGD